MLEIVAQAEPLEGAFLDALTDAADREAVERRGLLDTVHERPPDAMSCRRTRCTPRRVRASTPPSSGRGRSGAASPTC